MWNKQRKLYQTVIKAIKSSKTCRLNALTCMLLASGFNFSAMLETLQKPLATGVSKYLTVVCSRVFSVIEKNRVCSQGGCSQGGDLHGTKRYVHAAAGYLYIKLLRCQYLKKC
jgi:hypothetical protein